MPDCAAEERRGSACIFLSGAHSIANLMKLVTDNLHRKVDDGDLVELPRIPSREWVRLQFVPNHSHRAGAGKFTGRLKVKHGVQTRSLRKEHPDQHWVSALTKYYLEWIVELKATYPGVVFYGQDDKAKIPVGDDVPVSTGVRANNKAIVAADNPKGLQALDHDFHIGNIVASASLDCNIPESVSGSFFIDGKDGTGQVIVTLKDAIFDPSEVLDHTAQLIDTIRLNQLNPIMLALQTDGGPNHPLNQVATKLAMIAMF